MNAPSAKTCPQCGKRRGFLRLVSAGGFQLKGKGWYVTDFRDKPTKDGNAVQSDKAEQAAQSDKSAQAEKADKSVQSDKAEKTDKTEKAEKSAGDKKKPDGDKSGKSAKK